MTVAQNILVEVSPGEVRIAEIDRDDRLIRLEVERAAHPSAVGALCLGRIIRIEKALGGAFADIGLDAPAFLPRAGGMNEGESAILQVMRDGWADKGSAVTARPDLPGRYLVLHPRGRGVRWSRQLGGGQRRAALDESVAGIASEADGLIVRANAGVVDAAALAAEAARLRAAWAGIEARAAQTSKPAVLRPAPDIIERTLRDAVLSGTIVVDDRRVAGRMAVTAGEAMPDLAGRVEIHDGPTPLFEAEGVEEQIEQALARRVDLPGGGSLAIDTLEALTAIDVNTGGGARGSEAAALDLNRKAAVEAARQIMLRNVAGLIVIDFVSMRNKGHRKRLVDALRQAFRGDRVTTDVLGMTPAGLVEITRQRRGPSLGDLLMEPLLTERRTSAETAACAALRAVLRQLGAGRPVLRCLPAVADLLGGKMKPAFEETCRRLGQPVILRPSADCADFEVLLENFQREAGDGD